MASAYLNRILDPWQEFDRINRLFSDSYSNGSSDYPSVNVWVNGEDAVITAEVPGIKSDDLDISVSGNAVTISGKRMSMEAGQRNAYHRHELWNGDFKKAVKLPFNIDAAKVQATYSRGVLNITLPQLEDDKPRKIKVN